MAPPAVLALSESDSDESPELPRGVKRKADGRPKKQTKRQFRLGDELGVQTMLAKPCGSKCRRGCKDLFRHRKGYAELVAFRKKWGDYHKLDRDQMVFRHHCAIFRFLIFVVLFQSLGLCYLTGCHL